MTKSRNILIKNPIERFWKFVSIPDDKSQCWEWIGRKNYKGYGVMKINNHSIQSHRFSYELHIGKIPNGLIICHTCDNPACVNPKHLWAGTIADNNRDRDIKGRKALGEQNGKSKLTEKDVREILHMFSLGYSCAEIARKFNHPHSTIYAVKIGRSWKWLSK